MNEKTCFVMSEIARKPFLILDMSYIKETVGKRLPYFRSQYIDMV